MIVVRSSRAPTPSAQLITGYTRAHILYVYYVRIYIYIYIHVSSSSWFTTMYHIVVWGRYLWIINGRIAYTMYTARLNIYNISCTIVYVLCRRVCIQRWTWFESHPRWQKQPLMPHQDERGARVVSHMVEMKSCCYFWIFRRSGDGSNAIVTVKNARILHSEISDESPYSVHQRCIRINRNITSVILITVITVRVYVYIVIMHKERPFVVHALSYWMSITDLVILNN